MAETSSPKQKSENVRGGQEGRTESIKEKSLEPQGTRLSARSAIGQAKMLQSNGSGLVELCVEKLPFLQTQESILSGNPTWMLNIFENHHF